MATPEGSSGWESLRTIADDWSEILADERGRLADPIECPNDGVPLEENSAGRRRCPFDGWEPGFGTL